MADFPYGDEFFEERRFERELLVGDFNTHFAGFC